MGLIRNEMTIIHDWSFERISKLHTNAITTFTEVSEGDIEIANMMVCPIITSIINSEYTFIINGDCSKVGRYTSKKYHEARLKWCEEHKNDAESIVVINFGEGGGCDIVFDNQKADHYLQ